MFDTHKVYLVDPTDYIDKLFEYIPNNAFINKGRCGIGGTTLELTNTNRCSIIVAPTVGILKDKKKSHPDLLIVYADVTQQQVEETLAKQAPGQKIMTTPAGLKKVIDGATKLNIIDQVMGEWFLLLDECHTFISESYRKDILRPFQYFWSFVNKAIISATPYFFSDERFYTLDYHKIKFTETLGTITLVDCTSAWATLNQLIRDSIKQPGQLHIFLNSVIETKRTIQRTGLQDIFSIYCADDEDKQNMTKLGDLQKYFVEQPDSSNFSKVNFYTSKYFEGWDLHCEDATIVLVTDIHTPHTKVSVGMKLKQAAGRLRNTAKRIIHLTNHHAISCQPKSLLDFQQEYFQEAYLLRKQYVEYLSYCRRDGRKPKDDDRLERYADFEYKTKEPSINPMRVDQQINEAYSHEMYNNINLIKKEWEDSYYDVVVERSSVLLETNTAMKRKSKADQLKEDYLTIVNFNTQQTQDIQYFIGHSPVDKIRVLNPLAYQASKLLEPHTMDQLKYNVKKVQAELILTSNNLAEVKLLKLLNEEFKQGQSYSNSVIIDKLQETYYRLEIKEVKSGNIRGTNATDLKEWFDIEYTKLKDNTGKFSIHGWTILRPKFNMRVAA